MANSHNPYPYMEMEVPEEFTEEELKARDRNATSTLENTGLFALSKTQEALIKELMELKKREEELNEIIRRKKVIEERKTISTRK